jgi:DNA-binding transcriptional regulator YiaG
MLAACANVDFVPMHLSEFTAGQTTAAFSHRIKELRRRFGGKQWWLAYAAGCTDAAVSFWESGKRIPSAAMMSRIADALMRAGAPAGELALLQRSWVEAKSSQCEARGHRFAADGLAT